MKIKVEKMANEIKAAVDTNGPSYILEYPYEVFEMLVNEGADKRMASAILCVLSSGILVDMKDRHDATILTETIQKECGFNTEMAGFLAELFSSVYSLEHESEWKAKEFKGVTEFFENEFSFKWEGYAVWHYSTGGVECLYTADITLIPADEEVIRKEISGLTDRNPFVTRDAICTYYIQKLCRKLDRDFDYYCTCDSYYQPVAEDFFADDCVSTWCSDNGMKMIDCVGDGYDNGFDPYF